MECVDVAMGCFSEEARICPVAGVDQAAVVGDGVVVVGLAEEVVLLEVEVLAEAGSGAHDCQIISYQCVNE